MLVKEVIEIHELLDNPKVHGKVIVDFFNSLKFDNITSKTIHGENGSTDFIKIIVEGTEGNLKSGTAPTIGIIGRLGGIGARPEQIGFVSDGDGALAVLSIALKLIKMSKVGDKLKGDVIITTHICPDAPTKEHSPVPFMDSPVDMNKMNQLEVTSDMDSILTIDTTKGNNIINHKGFAISPTIKEGYILKTSEDLLRIMSTTTGKNPVVFPITQQDITPYDNDLYHINSILQPSVATSAPVVGIAITTETPVGGSSTGATHLLDVENAARYSLEVAKEYTNGTCHLFDQKEFEKIINLYGSMKIFQTSGNYKKEVEKYD